MIRVRYPVFANAIAAAAVFVAACQGSSAMAASPASFAPPRYSDIMPISQLKPGMTGYGLTVFRGTKIERFNVTIVGVVKKGSLVVPGHDMILVRMSGGPMTLRNAYLIRGMSGSPVYINGKCIGAFSMGEPLSKEPLGGVTPIEDMLEAWDPKLSESPTVGISDNKIRTAVLSDPLRAGGRTFDKVVYNVPLKSGLRSHGGTLVLHPCTTFMSFSATSRAVREKLAKALEPYNVELTQGIAAGQKPGFSGTALLPGSAFSMMLVTGDLTAGATGTVSYRKENRILGFGHPFMGIGAIEAPLCSAWIYDVYPLTAGSYKISSPGPVVGASTQDRNFSISGVIGRKPHTIPVTVDVRDLTTGRTRIFHSQTITHPNLYAAMVSASAGAAIAEVHATPGAAMARVTTTVDAEEIGKVTRTNIVFDARGIDAAATTDLDDLLGILTSNPFYPLGIKSAEIKVEIESGRKTAQVERIFLKEGKFEPGETAEVGIVIKPYKEPAVTRTVRIPIPANTPSGRYVLQVRGGAIPAGVSFGGFILRPQAGGAGEQAPPVSIRQMVNRYNEREKNDELVARILLPTMAVNVEGERLSNLPPALDAIMRSAKSSGVRLERDEVKVVQPTDWVISGQQLLTINVQRKDTQESPAGPSQQGGAIGGSPIGGSPTGAAFDMEFSTPVGLSAPRRQTAAPQTPVIQVDDDPDEDEAAKSVEPEKKSPDEKDEKPATPQIAPVKESTKGGKPGKKSAAKPPTAGAPAVGSPGTTPVPAETSEKPVGRQPLTWRQTTRSDFAKGDSRGLSVTTGGDLTLTRTLQKFQTSSESFVWSLAPDGTGGLYAGTGTAARILHFDANGAQRVVARLPEISVHSLFRAADGNLWAATGPNGRTYKIAQDGKFTVAHDAEEKYALAVIGDSKGNIFVGTGGGKGSVYRIAPDGKASLFFKTPEEHVLSLAVDKSDNVYAGTSSNGLVYRIAPDGTANVMYDAAEASITALGINSKGDVYAATAPRGVVYRIAQDGNTKVVFDKSASALTSLKVAGDDTVYAAGGSGVYAIRPDDTTTPFGNRSDIDILSLAVGENGTVYAGTGNVAEVYTAAPALSKRIGTYDSVVHDAKQTSRWGSVRWTANTPAGTNLRVQTRTGSVSEPDASWSPWSEPRMQSDGGRIQSAPSRFIQYRVAMDSDSLSASPSLREISVTYLPKNQPPKVTFSAPAGGERWARQQTIKWDASDPDKDTLTYELFYSRDNGASWLPVPGSGAPAAVSAETKAAASVSTAAAAAVEASAASSAANKNIIEAPATVPSGSAPPSLAAVQAELDKHPDLPAGLRDAILERARKVNADRQSREAGGSAQSSPAVSSAPIRETSRSLNTKLLPDGNYVFKVVTTDRPSNPVDPRVAEAISEPLIICNASPTVFVLHASMQVRADRTVILEGVALQTLIPISAVQFRVDNGEWLAAVPHDGIFDGAVENFTVGTSALTPGKHTIEVKAFNAANNTATEKMDVEVK